MVRFADDVLGHSSDAFVSFVMKGSVVVIVEIYSCFCVCSACGPSACASHRKLSEHTDHVAEWIQQPITLHNHKTDHGHGLPVRTGNGVLDQCWRRTRGNTSEVCQDNRTQELHRGEDNQHLSQLTP